MNTDSTDTPGAENRPGSDAPATGRTDPGPPPPAANQQPGEDALSSEPARSGDAGPSGGAGAGEARSAADGPEGEVVVGRPSAPDGEVASA